MYYPKHPNRGPLREANQALTLWLESLRKHHRPRSVQEKRDDAARARARRAQSPEKVRVIEKQWRQRNPEKRIALKHKRRARLISVGGSYTQEQLQARFDFFGNCCFYCHSSLKLTVDHDIPLSRGGSNEIWNILPACRACNSQKGSLTASEFFQRRGFPPWIAH